MSRWYPTMSEMEWKETQWRGKLGNWELSGLRWSGDPRDFSLLEQIVIQRKKNQMHKEQSA